LWKPDRDKMMRGNEIVKEKMEWLSPESIKIFMDK